MKNLVTEANAGEHSPIGNVLLLGLPETSETTWSAAAESVGAACHCVPDALACESHALGANPTVLIVGDQAFEPRLADPDEPAFGRTALIVVSDRPRELPLWGWVGWAATTPTIGPDIATTSLVGALTEATARRDESDLMIDFRRRRAALSANEELVFEAICVGRLNKQIARDFGVSVRTIEQRRRRLFERMGVESAVPLAALTARFATIEEQIRRQRPRVFGSFAETPSPEGPVGPPKFFSGLRQSDGSACEPLG